MWKASAEKEVGTQTYEQTPRLIGSTLSPSSLRHRKICGFHIATVTVVVIIFTIVVPFTIIGGSFISNGNNDPTQHQLTKDPDAAKVLKVFGALLLLEAGGLFIVDMLLLLGIVVEKPRRLLPYIVVEAITFVTGLVVAVVSIAYKIHTYVQVLLYLGFVGAFDVFAIYVVITCYLEMKEQERVYRYIEVRLAELAALSRDQVQMPARISISDPPASYAASGLRRDSASSYRQSQYDPDTTPSWVASTEQVPVAPSRVRKASIIDGTSSQASMVRYGPTQSTSSVSEVGRSLPATIRENHDSQSTTNRPSSSVVHPPSRAPSASVYSQTSKKW